MRPGGFKENAKVYLRAPRASRLFGLQADQRQPVIRLQRGAARGKAQAFHAWLPWLQEAPQSIALALGSAESSVQDRCRTCPPCTG